MNIISVISKYIDSYNLLDKDKLYLVALSGGADSTALLLILKQLRYRIEAIHCNFHLRGDESNRDEIFCHTLCNDNYIPFHTVHFDTLTYAKLHKVSIEMAARNLRYQYFEQLRKDLHAEGICVAHHQDDQAETILMNIIRGTGLHGLTGMQPRNGYILRPMLCINRNDIEEFLHGCNQKYVTDSTNLVDDVTRNKLRLNIIPRLSAINPSFSENICTMAAHVSMAEKVVNHSLEEIRQQATLGDMLFSIPVIQSSVAPEYTLYYIIRDYGFSSAQIQQISNSLPGQSGRIWESSTHELLIDRDKIILRSKVFDNEEAKRKSFLIPELGIYHIANGKKLKLEKFSICHHFEIPRAKNKIAIDADKVKFPLKVRHICSGDRFVPFGMHGRKLVSDFLTDQKKNIFDKRDQLVLTDTDDNIIWLIDNRMDNHFRISQSSNAAIICSIL